MNDDLIYSEADDSIIIDLSECKKVWNKSYEICDADVEEFPWEKDIPKKELDRFVKCLLSNNAKEGINILDFGCGTGRLGRYIENYSEECKGRVFYYDISDTILDVCNKKYGIPKEKILYPKLVEGKETVFEQENKKVFDGIIIWGVFHHLPVDLRDQTLRLVKKILAPNGVLLVADFDSKDMFFRNRDNRVSEITGKKTYSINLRKLLGKDFNFFKAEYYTFEENQKILEERIAFNTNSDEQLSRKKEERLNQNRKISYAIVEYSLLGKLKKAVVEGFDNSDFAHFLGYKFLASLNMPEHSVGEYYANNPKKAKQMWLHSMGLFEEYDKYRVSQGNKEEPLLESKFTLLLFHKALKRYSFAVESVVDANSEIKIELGESQNNNVFTNLYEIKLIVPRTLLIPEYVKSFLDNKKRQYWDYEITNDYSKDKEISFHKCAIDRLRDLHSKDEQFKLFDGNDLDVIFKQLDEELGDFINEHAELKELRQAIMMILLFVYPVETDSSKCCTKKTYISLVPPAFEMPLMKSAEDVDFKEISAGGAIIYTSGRPFDDEQQKNRFLWNVMKWSSAYTAKEIADYTIRMTVKAAKAAIMSRNMSHNLGSHVMFYIKQKLQSVERIFKEEALAKLFRFDSEGKIDASDFLQIVEGTKVQNHEITGLEMPFLVGLGRFINYLQERQDYVATVATDYIPYKSTINFKDAIYDELKPELRSQRHAQNKTNPEGKEAANLLLDYIAYSEGFQSSDRIEIWFENFNGSGEPKDVPINLRNLNVSLPGGNLGRQAFFSIMENIIRNTAKHDGNKLEGRNLRFRFDELDSENFNCFESFTNEHIYADFEEVIKTFRVHKDDYHYVGITVDTGGDVNPNLFERIGKGLNKEYVTPDGQIDDSNKGIKEIRISAAWLRGFSLDTVIPSEEPPAVAIINNNGNLQYVISLPKPKKVAFITGKNKTLDCNGRCEFAKPTSIKAKKAIADFELIVCKESDCKELRKYVGSRLLVVPSVDDYLNTDTGELYEEWLKDMLGAAGLPTLVINDEQSFIHGKDDYNESSAQLLIKSGRVRINSSDEYSDQLVYSKHYDASKAKQLIREKFYKRAAFLEGISGGNSTDRLLRHDLWSMEWYVKHMTAALTQVAVFDERIYSNFVKHGLSPYSNWDLNKLEKWLGEFENEIEKIEKPQVFLWQKARETISTDVNFSDVKELLSQEKGQWTITKDPYKLQQFIKKLHQVDVPTDCSSAELYAQKGIWAFTISSEVSEECDKTSSKVVVYGYNDGKEHRIATLSRDSDKVLCSLEGGYDKKFHFVTIHQGILDKIYETLSIENKKSVTEELFDKFSHLEKKESFLPQFVIHSGRSLPNKKDMPQEQPFIQFAALDHAIRDCKYTLTELLYSAHYE